MIFQKKRKKPDKKSRRIPILMYHEISQDLERHKRSRSMHPAYSLSPEEFELQMKYLHDSGFKSLTLEELVDFKNESKRNERNVVITFDDGHLGNFLYAFPILQRYGHLATFFVTVKWIGKENMLNWEQLREMNVAGMSIQSHTMSHRPLQELREEQIKYELLESKESIEIKLKNEVKFLSLPHGSFSNKVVKVAKETGYEAILTSSVGYFKERDNLFKIRRIPILDKYDIRKFIRLITQNRCLMLTMKMNKHLKSGVRKIIGIENYRNFYRKIFRIRSN